MRNFLDTASIAQSLDGERLMGVCITPAEMIFPDLFDYKYRGTHGRLQNIWLSDRSANQDYKSLAPQTALDLPRAALADSQKRGFQVAIAFVDPFGVIQVNCLDRRGRQRVR